MRGPEAITQTLPGLDGAMPTIGKQPGPEDLVTNPTVLRVTPRKKDQNTHAHYLAVTQ